MITELRDQKRASEGDGAQIATFHELNSELKAFKREFKLALVIQALAITLVVTIVLRLLP
ncbi:hypothetical protein RISW2_13630 [Roseivivax isoporae LMG 25204]|uniref:Uncharacterized protein n=1 Tax=Roseivivax isoporae LMG 25204 TaxID=1449351 RepID=X7F3Z8_9RHOB|nr:hypothetical protein RISW2_13630 [Roseivivax isoporae LMG 25204]